MSAITSSPYQPLSTEAMIAARVFALQNPPPTPTQAGAGTNAFNGVIDPELIGEPYEFAATNSAPSTSDSGDGSEDDEPTMHVGTLTSTQGVVANEIRRLDLDETNAKRLEQFSAIGNTDKIIVMFAELLAVHSKIRKSVDAFNLSSAGKTNIRAAAFYAAFSDKVDSYMDGMMKIALEYLKAMPHSGLPIDWDKTPSVRAHIIGIITTQSAQARGALKEVIKKNVNNDIKVLAECAGKRANIVITVRHWGRYSILRKLFEANGDDNYWLRVDDVLEDFRRQANNLFSSPEQRLERNNLISGFVLDHLNDDYQRHGHPRTAPIVGSTPISGTNKRARRGVH